MEIQFVETRNRYAEDGSTLALQDYVFSVDGEGVVVEVQTGAIQTLDGQLAPNEVELAAKTLIEATAGTRAPLILDKTNMAVVANRLNWRGRFNRG